VQQGSSPNPGGGAMHDQHRPRELIIV